MKLKDLKFDDTSIMTGQKLGKHTFKNGYTISVLKNGEQAKWFNAVIFDKTESMIDAPDGLAYGMDITAKEVQELINFAQEI
tara:strand:+ start:244 stop:489 length:246 start_codon:yes stop_codon:yes gene_type:complete